MRCYRWPGWWCCCLISCKMRPVCGTALLHFPSSFLLILLTRHWTALKPCSRTYRGNILSHAFKIYIVLNMAQVRREHMRWVEILGLEKLSIKCICLIIMPIPYSFYLFYNLSLGQCMSSRAVSLKLVLHSPWFIHSSPEASTCSTIFNTGLEKVDKHHQLYQYPQKTSFWCFTDFFFLCVTFQTCFIRARVLAYISWNSMTRNVLS